MAALDIKMSPVDSKGLQFYDIGEFKKFSKIVGKRLYKARWKERNMNVVLKLASEKEKSIYPLLGNHSCIISVFGITVWRSKEFLIMEYSDKGDLHDFKVSKSQLSTLIRDVVSGLSHCLSKNVIHRDIKPANIIAYMTKSRRIHFKIIDFDCSIIVDNIETWRGVSKVGTEGYFSPEMIKGEYDYTTDIWSLGRTFFNIMWNWEYNKDEADRGVYAMPPDIDDVARDLCLGMLDFNPKERFSLQHIQQHPYLK